MTTYEPDTMEEWQAVADAADLALLLVDVLRFGLVRIPSEAEPQIDREVCRALLQRAASIGVRPTRTLDDERIGVTPLSRLFARLRELLPSAQVEALEQQYWAEASSARGAARRRGGAGHRGPQAGR